MNVIFALVLILSTVVLIFISPDSLLSAMLNGGNKALSLSVKMIVIYAVWLGALKIAENCGITEKLALALKKPIKKIFGK